ncbi:MAG TPA: protein kinase, partial [Vicinamibacterales bacterium]
MRLTPGTRLGAYEVIDGLGAGGMGEVYRARDTSLHREIALKLVHPDYCHHADSMTRLRREARMLASLNHPNVATLHGLAEFGDSCGLVMELVPGETLAAILRRRRLKLDECVGFASQIAAALEAAHDHGVVHRDLKPANIKITPDGTVKVLDFGLAKAVDESSQPGAATLVTETGIVVGTAPYMSPEQARGLELDRRTDIWAFGCVLFEMLSGKLAFDGESRSDIVVRILEKEPEWSWLPRDTPSTIRRLLNRCLQKDVRRRIRDIGDVRLELEDAVSTQRGAEPSPSDAAIQPAQKNSWARSAALLAVGVALGAAAMVPVMRRAGTPSGSEVRFSVTLPEDERLASTELGSLAIGPDGRTVVYASSRGTTTHLLVRSLNDGAARPLAGTFGAVSPFFSPGGGWVGFFADGKLKKVPVSGGTPTVVCDAADGLGASWSSSGTIVFASATGAPLQRVSAEGGPVTRATELNISSGEFSHRWPEFLPDGDTVLFTVGTVGEWGEAEIVAQSLSTGARAPVIKGGSNPRYLASGYLAYAHDRAIWIVPFDASRHAVSGTPVRALEGVAISADGAAQFAV